MTSLLISPRAKHPANPWKLISTVFPVIAFLAGVRPLAAQQPAPSGVVRISIPGHSGGLDVDLPGFTLDTNEMQGPRRYVKGANPLSGVVFSVFLEYSDQPASADECRRGLRARANANLPFKKTDVSISELDALPVLEYKIPEAEGRPLRQGNLFACKAQGHFYADVHLSKVLYQPADRELFLAVLKTLHISESGELENVPPIPAIGSNGSQAMEYLRLGSQLYRAGKYKESIDPYQKALDLEKARMTLSPVLFRVLVDNLGMAYGMTGDLKHARETFDYGVSRDPTYPLFHYNLACAFAEMDDLDRTLPELGLAYKYKQNMIPGEPFPDPRTDDSFQRFMKNLRFLDFLASLDSPSPGKPDASATAADSSTPPAIRGILLRASGSPIVGAQVVLQSLDGGDCANLFNKKGEKSPTDAGKLTRCLHDLFTVETNERGEFSFSGVQSGWYDVRFLWNIEPKPSKSPSAEMVGNFLVMYAGHKDVTGRFDTLSQSDAFLFDAARDFSISFKY